jgi:hypothetical protein
MTAADELDPGELRETVAYVAIRRVEERYADIVTRRAWDDLTTILHPGVTIRLDLAGRSMAFHGPDELAGFVSRQLDHFDFFEFVLLNCVVEIDSDFRRAAARTYMQEARQTIATGERSDVFGVYHDVLELTEDRRWLITERHYRSFARTNPAGEETDMTVLGLKSIDLGDLLAGPADDPVEPDAN